jgi:hypothetical protein
MKLMYLAKRKPEFPSQEAFRPRWRQHGALAMSLPSWTRGRRYVHADALPPSQNVPAHIYDGVGVLWYAQGETVFSPTPSPEAIQTAAILQKDELEAFDGNVRPMAMLVDETIVRAGGLTDVTAYLFFDDADVAARAADRFAKLEAKAPERVVLNRDLGRKMSSKPRINYRGIVEVAARSREDLEAMLSASGVKADLVVLTHECLLWDNGPVAGVQYKH